MRDILASSMSSKCKWKTGDTSEETDRRVRAFGGIPRQCWTPEMWETEKQQKRDREKTRKRNYNFAFGKLKETLAVDKKLCHVDILRLAKETIISLAEQLSTFNRPTLIPPPDIGQLPPPGTTEVSEAKRRRLSGPPCVPLVPDGNLIALSPVPIDGLFDGDTADLLVDII